MAKTTSTLETIRRLMARAEHPETPPAEAELALRQANRLMVRHAIDEAVLRQGMSEKERREPVSEEWAWTSAKTEYHPYLRSMLQAIADANRCRVVIGGYPGLQVTVVGFREDVDWVQTLYMTCQLTFLSKLAPRWDKEAGIDANVYALKVAGNSWNSIWGRMVSEHFGIDHDQLLTRYSAFADRGRVYTGRIYNADDGYYTKSWRELDLPCGPDSPSNKYLLRAYRRHAKLIGDENPIETQRLDAYRRSFARGFADQIEHRLWVMRQDAEEEVASSGKELAMAERFEDVEDAFYRRFPEMHPDEVRRREVELAAKGREYWRKEREAEEARLAAMSPSARARYLEAQERKRKREQKSNERYWAERELRNRADHSGANLGRRAADGVSLTRSTPVKDEFAHAGKIGR